MFPTKSNHIRRSSLARGVASLGAALMMFAAVAGCGQSESAAIAEALAAQTPASVPTEVPHTVVQPEAQRGPSLASIDDLAVAMCDSQQWPSDLMVTATGPQQIRTYINDPIRDHVVSDWLIPRRHRSAGANPAVVDYVVCLALSPTGRGAPSTVCTVGGLTVGELKLKKINNSYSVRVLDVRNRTVTDLGEVGAEDDCPFRIVYSLDDKLQAFFYADPSEDELRATMQDYLIVRDEPSPDAISLAAARAGRG